MRADENMVAYSALTCASLSIKILYSTLVKCFCCDSGLFINRAWNRFWQAYSRSSGSWDSIRFDKSSCSSSGCSFKIVDLFYGCIKPQVSMFWAQGWPRNSAMQSLPSSSKSYDLNFYSTTYSNWSKELGSPRAFFFYSSCLMKLPNWCFEMYNWPG